MPNWFPATAAAAQRTTSTNYTHAHRYPKLPLFPRVSPPTHTNLVSNLSLILSLPPTLAALVFTSNRGGFALLKKLVFIFGGLSKNLISRSPSNHNDSQTTPSTRLLCGQQFLPIEPTSIWSEESMQKTNIQYKRRKTDQVSSLIDQHRHQPPCRRPSQSAATRPSAPTWWTRVLTNSWEISHQSANNNNNTSPLLPVPSCCPPFASTALT